MKHWIATLAILVCLALSGRTYGAEKNVYPAPRFPSYTKAPKSIDEVMPYARAIARQTTGLQGDGFGILKEGETVALVLAASTEDMVVQAIKRAIEEGGVKVNLLYEHELVGVSRADAAELRKARRQFSSEQGRRAVCRSRSAEEMAQGKTTGSLRGALSGEGRHFRSLERSCQETRQGKYRQGNQAVFGEESEHERFFLGHRRHNDVAALCAPI
ncbi:MAG TPA: hypothetical protein VGW77_02615 [Candidatus Binatia bacterium]|nr:hypothetical protein [Candidatus Binatia bacterium]